MNVKETAVTNAANRALFKINFSLSTTPKYSRTPTKKAQRPGSEGGAKDQRRRLLQKTGPTPNMSAIYEGSANKNANQKAATSFAIAPPIAI
jgi:hypothetical protein